ncbi:MAG TPA: hypothetical protein VKU40_09525 [Thermoanaerobaculia bacterium]|nr:hypothetical protein [Thermoanaerobaculia bacterium]
MSHKLCPLCGERFPRSAAFCDQDGVALVPDPAARRRRRLWVALAASAVLVATLVLALPHAAEWWLTVQLDVDVVGAGFVAEAEEEGEEVADGGDGAGGVLGVLDELAEVAGEVAGEVLGVGTQNLVIELRIVNRTPLPLAVRQARYTVRVAGQEIGSGTWTPADGGASRCAGGEQLKTTFTVIPTAEGALAIAGSLLGRKAPEVEVSGDLEVDFLFARSEIPFNVRHLGLDLAAESPRRSAPPTAPPSGTATAADRPEA